MTDPAEVAYNRAHGLPDNAAPVGMYQGVRADGTPPPSPMPDEFYGRVPQIPAGETVTSPFKVELTPDGTGVRITAYSWRTAAQRADIVHDIDPTDAVWLSTMIRTHALAIIEERKGI